MNAVDPDRFARDGAAPLLTVHGTPAAQARYLPGIAQGALWTLMAMEPGHGADDGFLETVASPCAGGWRISGKKIWCRHAAGADFGLVVARVEGAADGPAGLAGFIVDLTQAGVRVLPIPLPSGRDDHDEVILDAVFVDAESCLCPPGTAWQAVAPFRQLGAPRIDRQALRLLQRAEADPLAFGDPGRRAAAMAWGAALERLDGDALAAAGVADAGLVRELLGRGLLTDLAVAACAGPGTADAADLWSILPEARLESGTMPALLVRLGAALVTGRRAVGDDAA